MRYTINGMKTAEITSFEQYKQLIDRILLDSIGITSDDLPDCDYWAMYQNGTAPRAAVKQAIRNAKEY